MARCGFTSNTAVTEDRTVIKRKNTPFNAVTIVNTYLYRKYIQILIKLLIRLNVETTLLPFHNSRTCIDDGDCMSFILKIKIRKSCVICVFSSS